MANENTVTQSDLTLMEAELYSMANIGHEIIQFTHTDPATVWQRLCLEMEKTGYNVVQEARRFNVTPHKFDQCMVDFYQKSDGFMYETMVESRRPARADKWRRIVKFIQDHSTNPEEEKKARQTKILLYGDSVGTDSIYLSRLGYEVYYHDFDSYCSQFANWRFQQHAVTIQPFKSGMDIRFDFIVCLEVAEHVPDPPALIHELKNLLAENGYCLFSEAFGLQEANYPTHLRENAQLEGKTPGLFQAEGMRLYWRDHDFKPMVFTRHKKRAPWAYRKSSLRRAVRRIATATGLRRLLS